MTGHDRMLAFTPATANSPYIDSVRRREFRPRGRYVVIVVAAVSVLTLAVVSVVIPTSTWAGGGSGSAMTVRVDVKDLSAKQKREFVSAILKAKATPDPNNPDISRYDVFVNWHKNAFRCKNSWKQDGNYAGAAHNSPTFLPWHREYLHRFEAMLQDVSGDPDLALPYWDWTDPQSTKAVFAADFMGGSGDPEQNYAVTDGAFRKDNWTISIQDPPSVLADVTPPQDFIVRNFGSYFDAGIALPTKRQVKDSLDVHKYDHKPYDANSPDARSFRNTLEGWRDATPGECDEGWINVSQSQAHPTFSTTPSISTSVGSGRAMTEQPPWEPWHTTPRPTTLCSSSTTRMWIASGRPGNSSKASTTAPKPGHRPAGTATTRCGRGTTEQSTVG